MSNIQALKQLLREEIDKIFNDTDKCDAHYTLINNETGEVLASGDIILPKEES